MTKRCHSNVLSSTSSSSFFDVIFGADIARLLTGAVAFRCHATPRRSNRGNNSPINQPPSCRPLMYSARDINDAKLGADVFSYLFYSRI